MDSILEIKDLTKIYKEFILDNISFNLSKGYIMGLIGPNGAGKSTTKKLIMNLIKKNSGSIEIFDLDNIKYEKQIKQRIGFVYDENYFYDDVTTIGMKNVISRFYNDWDNEVFDRYMDEFNLPKNKKIKQLSFEALTNNKEAIKGLFKDRALIEKASLDDIMVYTVKGCK